MKTGKILLLLILVTGLLAAYFIYRPEPAGATVRYLNQETDPKIVNIQRGWVETYTAKYPDVRLVMESAPNINQQIATFVQSGAPLDVVHADGGSAAMLALSGLLLPIDDIVESLGGRDAFLPGRLLVHEDRVYAINQAATTPVLHYRKDLFEKAGLEPPDTWEELLNAARVLHSPDVAGIALPGGENRATTIFSGIFLWQNCGDFFNPELEVTIDNERTHEALEFYAELLKYAPSDAGSWAFTEPIESFWAGRSAMVLFWNGLDLTMRQNPALMENIGVVAVPKGRMRVSEQGGRYLCVFASSENPELSKDWIEHIFQLEQATQLSEVQPMLYPPVTVEALERLRQSESLAIQTYGDKLFDVIYPASEFAYNQIFNGGGIDPETCSMQKTGNINPFVSIVWNSNLFARAVQRVAYQDWDPKRAAAEAQKALAEQVEVSRAGLTGTDP